MLRADAWAAAEPGLARRRRISKRVRTPEDDARYLEFNAFHLVACGVAHRDLSPEEQLASLRPAARTWRVTSVPDADVLNGGFWQLFGNSTGDVAALSIPAFVEIGAPERAELFTRAATTLFDTTNVPPQAERLVRLEALAREGLHGVTIRALDDAYVALYRAQKLEELLLPYARARESDFFLD